MRKLSQAQINATLNYQNKALERVSVILSPHDQAVYDALQVIKAHHDGNRAGAIKQAILEYAEKFKGGLIGGFIGWWCDLLPMIATPCPLVEKQ